MPYAALVERDAGRATPAQTPRTLTVQSKMFIAVDFVATIVAPRCLTIMRTMVIVLALVLCSWAQRAAAMCGSPSSGISPPSGPLPTNPTIYVFIPHGDKLLEDKLEIKDTSYGGKLKYRLEQVGATDAFDTFRVVVNTDSATDGFTVKIGELASAEYTIAPATTSNRAHVTGVTHISDEWTCSHTDVIELALESNAVAYQLQWDDSTTTVVPPSADLMWGGRSGAEKPMLQTVAQLGHLNCMGNNIDPDLFDKPRSFELYALFADGSTHRLGAATAQLGEHGVRLPIELVGAASQSEAGTRIVPAPSALDFPVKAPWWWSLVLGAVGGLTVLVLGAIAERKKSHVPRV
jgi:hypothetical protein